MPRTVHCVYLDKEAEGLDRPPLPGEKGQWVYENVSHEAWKKWMAHQTRLINEKQLVLRELAARTYLADQMDRFFHGQELDEVQGYVPEGGASVAGLAVDAAAPAPKLHTATAVQTPSEDSSSH